MTTTSLVWFRQDLRLADNPALAAACARGAVVAIYILDEASEGVRPLGGASRWWLHHSLAALDRALGGKLVLRRGDPARVLDELIAETGADAVFWNRLYDAASVARDASIKAALRGKGVEVRSFNASLLFEPWEIKTGADAPYKVFTPFWRAAYQRGAAPPASAPKGLKVGAARTEGLNDWALTPSTPDWAADWRRYWTPGEAGARARLDAFLSGAIKGYAEARDYPARDATSRLSPHLHWGEISPRRIWAALHHANAPARDAEAFQRELGWREFSYHLLHQFPDLPTRNWKSAFDAYPWRTSAADVRAWRRGRTGYPYIDAGLRELWATGYMHNRVRMAVASFLIKHLRIDWRVGEAWFWDTLVDADAANNAASWQWVAGSGADAAPYFRIFNPVEQGRKFDADGAYVRRWIPELKLLPVRFVHVPFEAPSAVLAQAGVRLGETYPRPIVDHAEARAAALAGYERVKSAVPREAE